MGTLSSERDAATSHIANPGLGTCGVRAVGTHDAHLALVGILEGDERVVGGHGLGDLVPVSRIHGSVGGPSDRIRVASRVLKLPYRAGGGCVNSGEGTDIGVVRVCVVNGEIARVHLVHAVARVEIGERSNTGSDPSNVQRMSSILGSTVVGIVDHKLIFVGVSEEDTGNNVGGVSIDDLIEEICISAC